MNLADLQIPPAELMDISHAIGRWIQSERFDYDEYQRRIEAFLREYQSIYGTWYPKAKPYTDEHIALNIFEEQPRSQQMRHWCRYHMFALMKSLNRLNENIGHLEREKRDAKHGLREKMSFMKAETVRISREVRGLPIPERVNRTTNELGLVDQLVREAVEFLNTASLYMEGKSRNYGLFNWGIVGSDEPFDAAQLILRESLEKNRRGSYAFRPSATFLLRQSLELRLKNMFSVSLAMKKDGTVIKFPGYAFIDIIRNHPNEIDFPIAPAILDRIHEWTQYYIHGGFRPFVWTIEWAYYLLAPLFQGGSSIDTKSIYGAVKIKKSLWNQIDNEVLGVIAASSRGDKKDIKIIKSPSPEALIVD